MAKLMTHEAHAILELRLSDIVETSSSDPDYIRDEMHKCVYRHFKHQKDIGELLSRALRNLEVKYLGSVGERAAVGVTEFVTSFAGVVANCFIKSEIYGSVHQERLEFCVISFLSKWSSRNQPHWWQQAVALRSLLDCCHRDLVRRVPDALNQSITNIKEIVLGSTEEADVRAKYLDILQFVQCPPKVVAEKLVQTPHNLFLREMLSELDLTHLADRLESNAVRDATLRLPWAELALCLHDCGLTIVDMCNIKTYLSRNKVLLK